jgi:hypothetical protein
MFLFFSLLKFDIIIFIKEICIFRFFLIKSRGLFLGLINISANYFKSYRL